MNEKQISLLAAFAAAGVDDTLLCKDAVLNHIELVAGTQYDVFRRL